MTLPGGSTCPRCGFPYGEPSYEAISAQLRNCAFCRARSSRMGRAGKITPESPTTEDPTWKPEDGIK